MMMMMMIVLLKLGKPPSNDFKVGGSFELRPLDFCLPVFVTESASQDVDQIRDPKYQIHFHGSRNTPNEPRPFASSTANDNDNIFLRISSWFLICLRNHTQQWPDTFSLLPWVKLILMVREAAIGNRILCFFLHTLC